MVSTLFLMVFRGLEGEERMESGLEDKVGRRRGGCVKKRGKVF